MVPSAYSESSRVWNRFSQPLSPDRSQPSSSGRIAVGEKTTLYRRFQTFSAKRLNAFQDCHLGPLGHPSLANLQSCALL